MEGLDSVPGLLRGDGRRAGERDRDVRPDLDARRGLREHRRLDDRVSTRLRHPDGVEAPRLRSRPQLGKGVERSTDGEAEALRTADAIPDPTPIVELTTSYWASQTLFAANRIGLFEAIGDAAVSANEIAEKLGIAGRSTELLMNACASLDLLEALLSEGEAGKPLLLIGASAGRVFLDVNLRPPWWDRDTLVALLQTADRGAAAEAPLAPAVPLRPLLARLRASGPRSSSRGAACRYLRSALPA